LHKEEGRDVQSEILRRQWGHKKNLRGKRVSKLHGKKGKWSATKGKTRPLEPY